MRVILETILYLGVWMIMAIRFCFVLNFSVAMNFNILHYVFHTFPPRSRRLKLVNYQTSRTDVVNNIQSPVFIRCVLVSFSELFMLFLCYYFHNNTYTITFQQCEVVILSIPCLS